MTTTIARTAVDITLVFLRLGEDDPVEAAERLVAPSTDVDNAHLTVVGLDTTGRDAPERAVGWVEAFHLAWPRRYAETAASASTYNPAPPPLVVLMERMRSDDPSSDVDRQLAAAGAVVYERPDPEPADLRRWLEEELQTIVSRFLPTEEMPTEGSPDDRTQTNVGTGLLEYVEPVYQLRGGAFDEVLARGRRSDPLSTGD